MEERTLELLRTLQTAERTEAGFAGVSALLSQERPGLQARDDRATLADASELLELWADAAPAPIAVSALALAADVAERDLEQHERATQLYARCLELAPELLAPLDALQRLLGAAGRRAEFEPLLAAHADRLGAVEGHDPELLAQLLRRLGTVRDAASDLAGAIAAYERAVEHSADPELVRDLAEAYARRNAPGDGAQAADLFTMLAEVLGPPESDALVERALDLSPGHVSALTMLEAATPQAEHAARLVQRWERFVASADDDEAIDARRPALARAYLAAGREKDALACIGPLVDRGDTAAAELQAECLSALRASEAPTLDPAEQTVATTGEAHPREATLVGFRLPRSSSAPPQAADEGEPLAAGVARKPDSGVHKRPAQSGGTLVGFRLPPETIAALNAQDAAEASVRAQADVDDAVDARRDAAADPLRAQKAPAAAARASAAPVLTPAEHAARLRRSSSTGSIPAPAPAPTKAALPMQPAASAASPSVATPRPSSAPALSPAQLAQSLRSSASTPPPARSSSAELAAATAAAQHAASLRRSSPGSMPAPAPRAPAVAPAMAPLPAATAHAAALRRSSPGGAQASASAATATAMNLPEEEIVAAPKLALSAVEPVPAAEREREPENEREPAEDPGAYDPSEAAPDEAAAEAQPEPSDDDAPDGAAGYDPSAHEDAAGLAAPTPSTPPSAFAVAPSTIPNLPSAMMAESASRSGGSRLKLAIGAAAVVGIGVVVSMLTAGEDKPTAPATATLNDSAPSTATTAAPVASAPAASAPVAAALPAAAAPSAPPGLPAGLGGAVAAAPTPGAAAPTEAAPSTPTQDEKSLGKVELAGAARIKGGKLRPKDVADAVRAQLPALERCYTETLEDKPSAEGGLTFGFTVSKAGKATAVKKLSGTLKDAALARCAADALGGARFDKPKRPAKVTLPLRFAKR